MKQYNLVIDTMQSSRPLPAEVYIKTGQRTFFEYLLRPVKCTMSRAFREP